MTGIGEITISVSPEAEKLGIKTVGAIFSNSRISNRSSLLEDKKKEVIRKMKDFNLENNPILTGYRELYSYYGG